MEIIRVLVEKRIFKLVQPLITGAWLKMLLESDFSYPIFLHFRLEYVILSHPAIFQLITTTESVFFWTVFIEILRAPLLTLVPEAYARISGSYVIGSPQTFTWRLAVWK